MKCVIYYFSGTGNNLAIAKRLAEELGNTTVLPMIELQEKKKIPEEYDWVGFSAPSYFSHVPPFVTQCMKNLIFTREQKVFLIAGCAGNRGMAVQDMRASVSQCGKEVSLEYMVMLSGSYILSYGAFPKWYNDFFRRRSYRKIHRIAEDIRQNRVKKPLGKGIFYRDRYEEALQRSIASYPAVVQQYTVQDSCKHCGLCARICPVGNIRIEQGKPVFGSQCNQCMACIQWCPSHAIDCNQKAENRKHYHHADIRSGDMILR